MHGFKRQSCITSFCSRFNAVAIQIVLFADKKVCFVVYSGL